MRNFGPCMCGDTQCPSCGPAQGNNRCPICGQWDDDGGCENPEGCLAILERQAKLDEIAQEREYLQDKLIEHIAKQENCHPWDVDEEIRDEIRHLSLEDARKRNIETFTKSA